MKKNLLKLSSKKFKLYIILDEKIVDIFEKIESDLDYNYEISADHIQFPQIKIIYSATIKIVDDECLIESFRKIAHQLFDNDNPQDIWIEDDDYSDLFEYFNGLLLYLFLIDGSSLNFDFSQQKILIKSKITKFSFCVQIKSDIFDHNFLKLNEQEFDSYKDTHYFFSVLYEIKSAIDEIKEFDEKINNFVDIISNKDKDKDKILFSCCSDDDINYLSSFPQVLFSLIFTFVCIKMLVSASIE